MDVVSIGAGFADDYVKLNGGRSIKCNFMLQMIELLPSIKTTWHRGEFNLIQLVYPSSPRLNGFSFIRWNCCWRLSSCHTATIGSYFIEGHVPAEDIFKLLTEKPNARGLSVPGMPIGSPGMEMGNNKEPFDTLLVFENGKTKVFSSHAQPTSV